MRALRLHGLRPVGALLGLAALGGGVVALFSTDNGAASLFLITVGMVLLLVVWFGSRIELESFELLGAKVRVRQVVDSRLERARTLAGQSAGGAGAGAELREQALTLQRLGGLYGLYARIRATYRPGPRRTAMLDQVALRMQQAGKDASFDPAEVVSWFHDGNDPLRVIALNLMLARPEYRDLLSVLDGIEAPHSPFEQYYALRTAGVMLPGLGSLERELLRDAIGRARRRRRFRRDRSLMSLSTSLLEQLGSTTRT